MTSSFRLGRIAGVEIGVNWSWLVVFALITWSLAVGVFPNQDPGLSNGAYVAMAIVAALLFFVSLLAHELGHAVIARREGVELDGITLWLFGGVARFKGMFPNARAELVIALAGPAVSLAIGLACSLIAAGLALAPAVDGVLAWLGYVNLILLVFNLLPALPLDGGRVLRALLWRAKNDFAAATEIAASVGRGFGYAMIAAGVLLFIFQGAFSGAWLAFIGWFLLGAAGAEQRYLVARQALSGLEVRDLMTPDPVIVPAGHTIGQFMDEIAWQRRHTTYPVIDGGRVTGLLTFRCVSSVPRDAWDVRAVEDCMIPRGQVPELRLDDEAIEALRKLSESSVSRAIVLDGGRLAGIISAADISRALEARPRAGRGGQLPSNRIGAGGVRS